MYGITNAGGGSGTKSTLIISIDSGSTVQVYANSTYTTLIKTATEKTAGQFWVKGLDNGTYYLKATKGSDVSTTSYTITEYGVYRINMTYSTIPEFTYTGTYEIVDDSDTPIVTSPDNWKIRFLTSGTLNFSQLNGAEDGIDVFLVGGGGGGGGARGGGGGGGYTTTQAGISVLTATDYTITIGSGGEGGAGNNSGSTSGTNGTGGGESSAFGATASGGIGGTAVVEKGGNGGSGGGSGGNGSTNHAAGGAGGSDGGNGSSSNKSGGTGQGTTTAEFGESGNTLYSGGGGGGSDNTTTEAAGGSGGGGNGGNKAKSATTGTDNSGGGGGGGYNNTFTSAAGGSGIVIIRNARS